MFIVAPGHKIGLQLLSLLDQARAESFEKFVDAEQTSPSVATGVHQAYEATCREGIPLVSEVTILVSLYSYTHWIFPAFL